MKNKEFTLQGLQSHYVGFDLYNNLPTDRARKLFKPSK